MMPEHTYGRFIKYRQTMKVK